MFFTHPVGRQLSESERYELLASAVVMHTKRETLRRSFLNQDRLVNTSYQGLVWYVRVKEHIRVESLPFSLSLLLSFPVIGKDFFPRTLPSSGSQH